MYSLLCTVGRTGPCRFAWELGSPFGPNGTTPASPYFAVGENTAWGALSDYHTWWGNLSAVGANYARVWIGGISSMVLQTYAAGVWDGGQCP